MTAYLGNDLDASLEIIRQIYGGDVNTHVVSDGYENLIVIVDGKQVVRFPRSEEIWHKGEGERYVLQHLSDHPTMPIPKVIRISAEPAYMILTYLPGRHITVDEMMQLTTAQQRTIGRELAEFAYTLHTALTIDTTRPHITAPDWSYDGYLRRVLIETGSKNTAVDLLAKQYYDRWLHRKKTPEYVLHDDMHIANTLFDGDDNLVGVLDFGDLSIGTAEQELRHAYWFGDEALEAAAATYERLSGLPFDRETSKVWKVTQELAAYCRDDTTVSHERARKNLRRWFPAIEF